ncbi:MAG: phosphomannomutase/phosphoglucomutase [Spirochaetia bacterium]|nr:phosphomannomutase/phosphoglucomutase [Spirochaetia bacterium]
MGIVKGNDIRGIYPDELNDETAWRIGFYLKKVLGCDRILVGRDGRASSEPLFKALCKGIAASGADVVSIGRCDTPAVYFATARYGFEGSVMITASHNPPQYNGFKISRKDSVPVGKEDGLGDLGELIRIKPAEEPEKGRMTELDITEDYKKHLLGFAKVKKPLKVVVDFSQGASCFFGKKILSCVSSDFIYIFDEPDSSFSLHDPNPLKKSVHDTVKEAVIRENGDFGVCFDGDGDRAIFFDEKGSFISPDIITSFFASYYSGAEKGWKAFYDIRSSNSVREYIEKNGGTASACRTGHSHIKKLMKENNALFAGELSGHYYFRDNYFCDSGFIAFLIVLSALSYQEKSLSTLLSDINPYSFSGEINFEVDDIDQVIEKIRARYSHGRIDTTEGLRIDFEKWWFIARSSTAEPVLRLVVEAESDEMMKKHVEEITAVINGEE